MDRLAWIIGAGVLTLAFVALACIGCVIIWASVRATGVVLRQLWNHHVIRGQGRAEWQATPGEVWCFEFLRGLR